MANTGIENAEKIVKLTEEREAQTQKIKDLLKDIDKLSTADLQKRKQLISDEKILLQVKSKELKIAQGIYDTQEEIEALTDKESMLAFDIAGSKKKILKAADEIRKLESLGTKDAVAKAESLKEEVRLAKQTFDRKKNIISAVQAQDKIQENLLGNLNLSKGALGGMVAQAKLFGRALIANPYLALLAGFALILMYIKDTVSFSIKLSKELGVSASQAGKLSN